jgi:hypothetical protein
MTAQITSVRQTAGPHRLELVEPTEPEGVYRTPVPHTPLLTGALPVVDWSDAYAVRTPSDCRDPQAWADAIFHGPPPWVRALFGAREVVARLLGIERGGSHVFATVNWRPSEVLLGTDQGHLSFRASVLVEPGRVVLSTVVHLHNRRGRAYSAFVRTIHPWVVRGMLARAARTIAQEVRGMLARAARTIAQEAS